MSSFQKLLPRRERHSRYSKHLKEETSNILTRPLFRGFFSSQSASENGDNQNQRKIKQLERRIAQLGITDLKEEHIGYALQSAHAQGDVDKAFDLLLLLEDSIEGIIRGYTPSTKLLGAENRQGVTCYLDALLFAMFARLDCFEPILHKSFEDEPRRKLAVLLRFWVNMLRSGKLIMKDMTKYLQDALAECGWRDASTLHQQDASEAFTFITEKLELPLLTLKMDIYHTGKEDASGDHKFINERLLEVAIPEPTDGKTVTLEDCLESYFNNKIEVKRHLERRNTTRSVDSMSKGFTAHVEAIEVGSTGSSPIRGSSPRLEDVTPLTSVTESIDESATTSSTLDRRDSIVQERFVPDSSDEGKSDEGKSENGSGRNHIRKGSYRKEVMMPAWQFFSLIPWYTDNTPKTDAQVAEHISVKRPILGMCLKRYSMLPNGRAVRRSTFVDIPTEIGLPHFIQDDNMDDDAPIYGNFKLALQSLVCHRGNSVDSGHYIAIVRGTSAGAAPAVSNGNGTEQTVSDDSRYWMRFDDLAAERVTLVDIEQALKNESPYLLFYQILPIDEDAAKANLQHKASSESSDDTLESNAAGIARRLNGLSMESSNAEECTTGRPSFEITAPIVTETEVVDQHGAPQGSIFSNTDPSTQSGGLHVHTTSSTSPKIAPKDKDEDATSSNPFSFSRRGSRVKSNSGSRAGSQNSENRISATFSRFTGRLSRDKLGSDDQSTEGDGDEYAVDNGLVGSNGEKFAPSSNESKEKDKDKNARGRNKDRDRWRGKAKDKTKEKTGRRLERECVIT
ncbi:hypothetical protein SI65_03139 [Aspergillus cristatus]|uniref:ubiquitinyl hydrolase 1 n=1 Tax=Aspergillus cristatus TaxID=573508 RepID=A0A1E3BMU6_ASPCR|nr:hypothetical protein SI65_03139 [Aspergillus cristatus]